ncbi:MAG: hypothetical protein EYC70_15195 [Planctomycetota bacterium]|nr:MAG: hypothetical protein EYC70_15195 [Planctomycetota bacterium]
MHLFLTLAAALPAVAQQRHLPHDSGFSVAVAPGAEGAGNGLHILVAGDDPVRCVRSVDDALSWTAVTGAGLERTLARDVVYYATASARRFLIGSESGVYACDPDTGVVSAFSDGLPLDDRNVLDLDVPRPGHDGPALLVTSSGTAYLRYESAGVWQRRFSAHRAVNPGSAAVAVVPHFDATAGVGPRRVMLVAIDGRLYYSKDGGLNWAIHPGFNTFLAGGWTITAIAFDEAFESTGILLLGRGRENPDTPGEDEGQILRSRNFGFRFALVRALRTAVGALLATPPGPGGQSHFFAAGHLYPNVLQYDGVGVLRSDDGGATWGDFGNDQDFGLELDPNNNALPAETAFEQELALSPDFASDGTLFYARGEGLFQSYDEGLSWRQKSLRPESDVRGIAAGSRAGGDVVALGASYGSSLMIAPASGAGGTVEDFACPMAYQKAIAVSPRFADDGTVVFSGSSDLCFWYDPSVPAANPYGVTGYVLPPLTDLESGLREDGYPRTIAISPHYDGRGLPGTDQTVIWSSWEQPPMRTSDGGVTAETLPFVSGGGSAPFMEALAIAPTYDASAPARRTDVYGGAGFTLYRLADRTWTPLLNTQGAIRAIAVDPGFRRPDNPRLFVATSAATGVFEVLDDPTGASVQPVATGLQSLRITDLALRPDFSAAPVLYALSWGQGVYKLDAGAGATAWEKVGLGAPEGWSNELALSPAFAADRTLFLATSRGLMRLVDDPLEQAQLLPTPISRDDRDVGYLTFAPNHPNNPQPLRPWPWREVKYSQLPGVTLTNAVAHQAVYDGSWLETSGYARQLRLRTATGADCGTVSLAARDYWTGEDLGSLAADLDNGAPMANHELVLPLSRPAAVRLRLSAQLDPGETLLLDTLLFEN